MKPHPMTTVISIPMFIQDFSGNHNQNPSEIKTKMQYSMKSVPETFIPLFGEDAKYVGVTDVNEDVGLIQFHHKDNAPEEFPVRGWIVDAETKQVVCASFPKTPDVLIPDSDIDAFELPDTQYYVTREGTLIRVYTYQGIPEASTQKKITCLKSKWGNNPTFHQQFHEALRTHGVSMNDLKSDDRCYVFFLVHHYNQLTNSEVVVNPYVLHVGTLKRGEIKEDGGISPMIPVESDDDIPKIPKPQLFNRDEARQKLKEGYSVMTWGFENKTKFTPESLQAKYILRGENPVARGRWMELIGNKDAQAKLPSILPQHMANELRYVEEEVLRDVTTVVDHRLLPLYKEFLRSHNYGFESGITSIDETRFFKMIKNEYYEKKRAFEADPKNVMKRFVLNDGVIRKTMIHLLMNSPQVKTNRIIKKYQFSQTQNKA